MVVATILSMFEKGERKERRLEFGFQFPEGEYLIIDFCPTTLTAERHSSNIVDREGFIISDELNEKFIVNGWSSCNTIVSFHSDLEVIEGGFEE